VTHAAQRIVSLLPSATEWVCWLGLQEALVGVSHECDYPPVVNTLPRVTRSRIDTQQTSGQIDAAVRSYSETQTPLYELDTEAVVRMKPDLILTQSLCNVCAVSQRDVLRCISDLGGQTRTMDLRAQTFAEVMTEANELALALRGRNTRSEPIESLHRRIAQIQEASCHSDGPRPIVTLLEWVDPLFCSGHWTPQLIQWAGGDDPIGRSGEPSRVISPSELLSANPDILLVACCGMDADRTRAELSKLERIEGWSELRCVKSEHVFALDGSAYFNRPGPRLVDALEMVARLVRQWSSRDA
jgi:iron complex transport system substrate-binding protein